MDIFIKASQFVLSLSLLIVAHEMGHFLFAKLFSTRVEKFYLFFDPWFSLFKIKKGHTEYGVGWIPLGGYVKISGMIDESMDREQMAQPPQPWEFRTKPAWQRLLIMVGGVVVNFVSALLIFAMILFTWGEEYIPVQNAVYGFNFCETALKNGFQNGDKIIAVDGVAYETMMDVTNHILLNKTERVSIERDGERLDVVIPLDFTDRYLSAKEKIFAVERFPWVADRTVKGSPAEKAGLISGDVVEAVNGTATPFANLLIPEIKKNAGKEIQLTVRRNGAEQTMNVQVSSEGTIGVYPQRPEVVLHAKRIEYGFGESFPAGVQKGVKSLTRYVKSMKLVFTREGAKQVGGFIAIADIFPPTWDWEAFWTMTAFLSIILAFMNILPIPALDGGHVLFVLYEMITGRKPSDKFLERAQIVGMVILIGLLVLANGNDVIRLFK